MEEDRLVEMLKRRIDHTATHLDIVSSKHRRQGGGSHWYRYVEYSQLRVASWFSTSAFLGLSARNSSNYHYT